AAYALAAIPTRYAFERNDWEAAAALQIPELPHWNSFPFMEALIEYGHALGRAHIGDLEGARKAIARMQQLRDATKDPKFDYFKSHLDLQMQAASAWLAVSEGKKKEAIDNETASRYYTRLAAQTARAGGSRNELNHIREFLSVQAKAADAKGVAARE